MRKVVVAAVLALQAGTALAQEVETDGWWGNWSAGTEQTISVEPHKKALVISGFATFGADDPERVKIGAINIGEFTVRVPRSWIIDNRLVFTVNDAGEAEPVGMQEVSGCMIEMELRGETMAVGDSGQCGGLNVSFSGQYRRG